MQKMKVTFWQNVARVCTLCMAALAVVGICLCTTVKPASAADDEIIEVRFGGDNIYAQWMTATNRRFENCTIKFIFDEDYVFPATVRVGGNFNVNVTMILDLNGHVVDFGDDLRCASDVSVKIVDTSAAQTGQLLCKVIDIPLRSEVEIASGIVQADLRASGQFSGYWVYSNIQITGGVVNGNIELQNGGAVLSLSGGKVNGTVALDTAVTADYLTGATFKMTGGSLLPPDGQAPYITHSENAKVEISGGNLYENPEQPDPVEPDPVEPETPTTPTEPTQPETPTTPTVKGDDGKVNVGAIAGGVSAAAVVVLGGVTAGVVTVLKRKQ